MDQKSRVSVERRVKNMQRGGQFAKSGQTLAWNFIKKYKYCDVNFNRWRFDAHMLVEYDLYQTLELNCDFFFSSPKFGNMWIRSSSTRPLSRLGATVTMILIACWTILAILKETVLRKRRKQVRLGIQLLGIFFFWPATCSYPCARFSS